MTEAGNLRERVTIEAPSRNADGAGGADIEWTPLATVWAEVADQGGNEQVLGERTEARARHRVTMRHRGDVTAEMRLVWRGRTLDIRALRDPDGRRQWLAIDTEGGTA
ncbi:MAG: phage head closure protein [Parvibaculum sp.]|uniref:phage head closure protein n=1 Tax=Parvibaculum sp. TaxID=2024848 RepID=UPI0025D1E0D5|nr:phage head closure protein [Parvibaculum sp.]MCE9650578.1 phage head closure protein [Parvibaculum sp.]